MYNLDLRLKFHLHQWNDIYKYYDNDSNIIMMITIILNIDPNVGPLFGKFVLNNLVCKFKRMENTYV